MQLLQLGCVEVKEQPKLTRENVERIVKQLNETQHLWVALGALGLALLLVLTVFFSGAFETHEVMGQKFGASRGFGLWLSLLGSLAGAGAAFMATRGTSPIGAPKPPAP